MLLIDKKTLTFTLAQGLNLLLFFINLYHHYVILKSLCIYGGFTGEGIAGDLLEIGNAETITTGK